MTSNLWRNLGFTALTTTFLATALFTPNVVLAQGGSAVITLVMPVGARQLGMGETAVAIADDVFATFWNPAGLAFGPVANEWEVVLDAAKVKTTDGTQLPSHFTALATKPRTGFLVRSVVWAGTTDGLLYYDGKKWRSYYEIPLEQGDAIDKVVRRYLGSGDHLDSLVAYVKAYNGIKTPQDEADLIALKLPYNLLFTDHAVTALALDNADRLWVGTNVGLFRFDGQGWKSFDKEEGFTFLPDTSAADTSKKSDNLSDTVTAVSRGGQTRQLAISALAVKGSSVWIGTPDGLYEYRSKGMVRRGESILPVQSITAIATQETVDEVYVGLAGHGIARYAPPKKQGDAAKWKLYGVVDGMLDSSVKALVVDKYQHVYAAHDGGVSHFNGANWERVNFKKQDVTSLTLDEDNNVWIGTNEGAWKHTPYYANAKGRSLFSKSKNGDDEVKAEGKRGTWTHYHTGNGLHDKHVTDIRTQGPDVWFLTDAGVERYNSAKDQVGFFYESLLPVLNLPDLYHAYMGATFPIEEWGTLGGFVNFVSFGQNVQTNSDGQELRKFDAYELVSGLSYGTRLTRQLGLGINAKFIYSALAAGVTSSGETTDGVAASYAVDLGLLYKDLWIKGLSAGLVLQNMGPAVFYVDQAQSDPIPFTWKVGLAYEVFHTTDHRLTVGADVNREAVYRNGDEPAPFWEGSWKALAFPFENRDHGIASTWKENVRQSVFDMGAEYAYANVVAIRTGYLYDESGKRYELDLGLGFMISDILQVDGTFIRSFDNGIRNNQKRFSMVLRF